MKRSDEILNVIRNHIEEKGYSPSVREIGKAVGLTSSATVHGHLDRLRKKGYIDWDSTKPRTLKVVKEESVLVPVYTPEGLARAYKNGNLITQKAR